MINNLKIIIFSILAVVVVLYIPVILNMCSAISSYPRDTLAADNAKGRRTDFNANTNNSSFTNKSKFTNYINVDIPYMAHNISSLLNETNLVHSGMIILRNANQLVQGELDFEPWGQTEKNNLTIDDKNGTPPLFIMSGSTGKDYAGFELKDLDYRGNYISLVIGKSAKTSAIDYQISFTFTIEGNHGNYILTFVRGILYPRGWIGNHYYEKINAYSSRLISLHDLIADDNLYLRKIDLVMQNNSILNSLEFRIDLDRTTENPPVHTSWR